MAQQVTSCYDIPEDDLVAAQRRRSVPISQEPNRVKENVDALKQLYFPTQVMPGTFEIKDGKERAVRTFDTGATRDTDEGKLDYEGFLSDLVVKRYGEYMHKNRIQSDGSVRDSDNWQKGMPITQYMKSLWRHFMDVWKYHRYALRHPELVAPIEETEEALCGVMFNSMGMLHEILKRNA